MGDINLMDKMCIINGEIILISYKRLLYIVILLHCFIIIYMYIIFINLYMESHLPYLGFIQLIMINNVRFNSQVLF